MLIKGILNDISEIQKYYHAQVPFKTYNHHYSDHHLKNHHLPTLYIIKYHYQSQVILFKDNKE